MAAPLNYLTFPIALVTGGYFHLTLQIEIIRSGQRDLLRDRRLRQWGPPAGPYPGVIAIFFIADVKYCVGTAIFKVEAVK